MLRSADINARIQWNRLPGTLKEGSEISEIISADLFLSDSATPNAVKNSIDNPIIHVASHAFYLPYQPAWLLIVNLNLMPNDLVHFN